MKQILFTILFASLFSMASHADNSVLYEKGNRLAFNGKVPMEALNSALSKAGIACVTSSTKEGLLNCTKPVTITAIFVTGGARLSNQFYVISILDGQSQTQVSVRSDGRVYESMTVDLMPQNQ